MGILKRQMNLADWFDEICNGVEKSLAKFPLRFANVSGLGSAVTKLENISNCCQKMRGAAVMGYNGRYYTLYFLAYAMIYSLVQLSRAFRM